MDKVLKPMPFSLYGRAAGQYRYNAMGAMAALLSTDHMVPSDLKDDTGAWLAWVVSTTCPRT